ncbi:vWA domain-containing protein [Paraliomyxa miuraensis]|uniref:vWA domain-containing protein n=1 Tax=Paraliomyxa miuraensis TaxID=376150 RepID=UPI002251209F|nr:vWA domain-containing protein [Paraliomyxa miuraensis]MCX4246539.1 VWA domain-containing protein [Paraliomyxa miuraensis]
MKNCSAWLFALGLVTVGCGDSDRDPPQSTEGFDTDPFGLTTGDVKLDIAGGNSSPTEMPPEFTSGGCADVQVQVEPIIPTLVLLVDQSGSMTDDFSGQPRWEAIYETLMDPADGVVSTLQSSVRFGLTLYTSEDGFDGGECPLLTTVEPALDNHGPIDAEFAPADPVDETPTGESLAAVAQQLAAFQADGPKGIVLATDGEPDTCEQPNPQEGQQVSLDAAAQAFELGITTYIISVGDDVGADHLQQMANVGVGKDPDDPMPAPYYQALDAQQLVDAFEEIIGTFVSCELLIDGEVDLSKACEGSVFLDGMELQCDVDYHLPDANTLELLGDACATLQDGGEHQVDAVFPCDAVHIP